MYTITHNLGLPITDLNVKLLYQIKITDANYPVGEYLDSSWDIYIGSSASVGGGLAVSGNSNNEITISTSNGSAAFISKTGGYDSIAYSNVRLFISIHQIQTP